MMETPALVSGNFCAVREIPAYPYSSNMHENTDTHSHTRAADEKDISMCFVLMLIRSGAAYLKDLLEREQSSSQLTSG